MPDAFDRILGQPQVRSFLRAVVAGGRIGQAYLFTGPAGSNKTLAAYALAQAAICQKDGCGDCDDCKRVMRRKHPDVRYYAPEGADGYLVSQIREIVGEVELAPIRASRKVYIIDRVDLMGTQPANAFLKTLEEPPDDVVMILLGRTRESVLPTIVSRCQVVPFRHIPASEACGIVRQNTGASALEASVGIQACDGSISRAIEFVRSPERLEYRRRVLEVLSGLALSDDLDIIDEASELLDKAKAPLDLVRADQQSEIDASSDFLDARALKQIELRNKRALTAKTSQMLGQTIAIMRSWLRDVLMVCSCTPNLIINEDARPSIEEAAASTDAPHVVCALRAAEQASAALRYNVSPETCFDVLLMQIREELYGSHSTGTAAI